MITNYRVNETIAQETYLVMPDGRTTICQLTLLNGFTVIGTSACVDPDMFDLKAGRRIAFENARQQIWQLEGYLETQDAYIADMKKILVSTSSKTLGEAPKKAKKAAYHVKADGTPRRKPGRPSKASKPVPVTPTVEAPQPAEAATEVA